MLSFGLYTKGTAYTLVVGIFLFNHSVVPKAYFEYGAPLANTVLYTFPKLPV